ncbi:hypothetical protein FNV43_RR05312 [Rhamnella rubrinervis]|uniref:Protein FLC EXPRESSOR n=1 Tax=Rhamnella rubrinervis TaxID=2594499 RepID=A0A8K0MQZ2_9ROSA|nr:hypothetical protein FNV43_RR05312 [Rhamnella rubrinervis]
MAGRYSHPRPNAVELRHVTLSRVSHNHARHIMDSPRLLHRAKHHHSSTQALEDRIEIQHREIQSLLLDNQRLAATHVALKQELALAHQDLRSLSAATANAKAELDAHVREVYERSLNMDAEVRSIDAMSAELDQVRVDVQKLVALRKELTAELQAIEDDLARASLESKQVEEIKAEIDTMHQEIQRGRAAIEYERKTCASNLEHKQAMEKSMVSMAHTIEKLHAELDHAEKRAMAAAAAANPNPEHPVPYGNSDMAYRGQAFPDPYGIHQPSGSGR